jgi:hypothetical protein
MKIVPDPCPEYGWKVQNPNKVKNAVARKSETTYDASLNQQKDAIDLKVDFSVLHLTEQNRPEEFQIKIVYPPSVARTGMRARIEDFIGHNESLFISDHTKKGDVKIVSTTNPKHSWNFPFSSALDPKWNSIELRKKITNKGDEKGVFVYFSFRSRRGFNHYLDISGKSHVDGHRDTVWHKKLKEMFGNSDLDLMQKACSPDRFAPITRWDLPKSSNLNLDNFETDVVHQICNLGKEKFGYFSKSLLFVSRNQKATKDLPQAKNRTWEELQIETSPGAYLFIYTLDLVMPSKGDADSQSLPISWPKMGVISPKLVRSPFFRDQDDDLIYTESIKRKTSDDSKWDLTIEGTDWGVNPKPI